MDKINKTKPEVGCHICHKPAWKPYTFREGVNIIAHDYCKEHHPESPKSECQCACHANKLNKPYEHDLQMGACCDKMNGYVEEDCILRGRNKNNNLQKLQKPIYKKDA